MRLKLGILTICALSLGACGPRGSKTSRLTVPATTGFFDAEGIDYTDGGDSRVADALVQTPPPPPTTSREKPLAHKLKEFEISRFAKGETTLSQLGTDRAMIKVFFTDRNPVEFLSSLEKDGDVYKFSAAVEGFTFTGSLEDTPAQTLGEFHLTHTAKNQQARIFYRAYKGKLDVRGDRTHAVVPGSRLEQQMKALKDHAFAWVHNWVVLNGPSVYLVDVVNTGDPKNPADDIPVFIFKGESKRTGAREHNATTVKADPRTDVSLVGNSEEESRRLFSVQVKERADQPPEEFMLEVEMASPPAARALPAGEIPVETAPSAPDPRSADFYMKADGGTPRSARMVRDFDKNRDLPGVRKFIAEFQRNARRDLENFYNFASPFRGLIESIGQTFDVSPSFAYLTVVESVYFTGGRYQIQAAGTSSALGPFQLLDGTARELGVRVTGGDDDERRFFVPSACGAAKYVRKLVDMFSDSDSTVSILAYYQGDGGAAAAIHCSFGANESPAACASRINKGFSGSDYARFKRLAKSYNYTYMEMDRLAVIPAHMRNYVNKKLAVYFISSDMKRYGFKVGAGAPRSLPGNGTVFPAAAIQDNQCRSIAQKFTMGN